MREILFRGKRKVGGEWVQGFLFVSRKGEYKIKWYDPHYGSAKTSEVHPETVGQFTGLTDKNGKKIFEGDVMEFEAYGLLYRGVVTIEGGNTGVFCKGGSPFLDDAIKRHDAVKIGNIHDNPELLEVE